MVIVINNKILEIAKADDLPMFSPSKMRSK
jgi:hypothetical protein